jgi:hypothetical protein
MEAIPHRLPGANRKEIKKRNKISYMKQKRNSSTRKKAAAKAAEKKREKKKRVAHPLQSHRKGWAIRATRKPFSRTRHVSKASLAPRPSIVLRVAIARQPIRFSLLHQRKRLISAHRPTNGH